MFDVEWGKCLLSAMVGQHGKHLGVIALSLVSSKLKHRQQGRMKPCSGHLCPRMQLVKMSAVDADHD